MSGVVIADTGPLIGLARLQRLTLLQRLFGEVLITTAVRDEILPETDHADKVEIQAALNAGWLQAVEINSGDWRPLYSGVDAGEGNAIYLASQMDDVPLIMDDRAGRTEATARRLRFIGTAAVIGMAKLQGLIPLARPVLQDLHASGYHLSKAVIQAVLEDVGE